MPLGKKYYTHHLLISAHVACGLNPHERERERSAEHCTFFRWVLTYAESRKSHSAEEGGGKRAEIKRATLYYAMGEKGKGKPYVAG